MDRLQNIETFVRVAQTQSFAEAARQLRVAKSVVTSRIKQLEDYLGAPLFHRSTRVVRLSDLGTAFLRDCTELVGRASDLVDQMRDATVKPSGSLRVHALTGFVLGHFASLLRDFQASYLTRVGHMTDDKRQEFILLSDTLGLSMLTVAMNSRKPAGCTEATVFRPSMSQAGACTAPGMRARQHARRAHVLQHHRCT